MKGLRSHYEFLACGRELVPLELNPTQHLSLPFPPSPVEPRKPLAPKLPLKPRDSDWFDIAEPLQAGDRLDHSATLYYRRPGGDPWTQHRMPPIDYARNGYEEDHQPRIIHSQEISKTGIYIHVCQHMYLCMYTYKYMYRHIICTYIYII